MMAYLDIKKIILLLLFLVFISLSVFPLWAATETFEAKNDLKVAQTFVNPDFKDAEPSVRLKDVTSIQGVRENFLIGRGLIVGLNGTGDSLPISPQTKESLISMLERLGVNVRDGNISGKNVAMVMVTATLPPFPRTGSKIDIEVSALGDAKSLNGGTLLVTPLQGADGKIYAVAQGKVSVSGITAGGANAQQIKGVPTSGKVANGAIVEKQIDYDFKDLKKITLLLHTPDMTTATRIVDAINVFAKTKKWSDKMAELHDMGTIELNIPKLLKPIHVIEAIGHLEIRPDTQAKIVIDENNGVIAMSSKTRISPIALTHGSITIKVVEEPRVYMPTVEGNNYNYNMRYSGVNNMLNGGGGALVSLAQRIKDRKELQAEQMALYVQQQNNELEKYKKDNNVDENNVNVVALMTRQKQDRDNMQTKFQQELDEISKDGLSGMNTGGGMMGTGLMMPGGMGMPGMPPSNGSGEPVVTTDTKVDVKEEKGKFSLLSSGPTIDKFVNALNQLGVSVKDMGAILMAIKNAGALHAKIEMS